MGEGKWKLKNFWVEISGLNFVICASWVVLLVYQERQIDNWLGAYYWWVKESES